MVPSSNQLGGGSSSMNPSLLRANSNLMSGSHPPNPGLSAQSPFSSLVSPRTGFTNSNLLGNISNVSALLNRPSMNNGPGTDLPGPSIPDPLSFPSSSTAPQNLSEHQPSTQLGQHQDFSNQMKQELPNGVKLEPGSVKLEQPQAQLQQQQMNQMRIGSNMGGGPVKMETDAGTMMLIQQQRVMQQQQRLMQLHQQQQQQQQMTKQHRGPQSGVPQQIPQQNNTVALRGKSGTHYEPGTCARRLTHYMFNQQKRPQDNNIEFWRSFVGEYYAPNAKKRWCVSLYGSGRQPTGVFPQDVWHCEICNRKPGRGFETTVEVLPRLCQIKYASGTIEELLYVDMPKEYPNPSGQIVLDYAKAIQESVFDQLRVVREGQLRIVFNSDLKIASWEFCARRHEELIPRRSIIPQVSQLGDVVRKYQSAAQNSAAPLSTQDLQNTCNSFVGSARQLAKALEVPLVNDLGYTKRYVRCLQIAEVVNCMKDLIDYSRQTGTGPMESLNNFPRRNSSAMNNNSTQLQSQQPEQIQNQNQNQNPTNHNASNGPNSSNHTDPIPIPIPNTNNTTTPNQILPPVPTPQNPIKQELQIPAPNRTPNPNPNPVPSTSNSMMPPQQPSRDTDESQSSVQRILQEMMMSSQLNGVNNNSNEMKPRANGGLNGYGTGPVQSGLRGSMSSGAVMMNGPVQLGMGGQNHNPMGGNNLQQEMGGQMMRSVNSFNNLYDWKSNQ